MSTTTVLIALIALGYFATLVWFRDRVVRWKAIGFGLFGILILGLFNIAIALIGIVLGWVDLSAEIDIHMLGNSISYFLMLAAVVCLLQSLLPADVGIHQLWPSCLDDESPKHKEPPPAE